MNELLKVDFKNAERPTVSGRGLHAALGVQTRYSDWFGRMCEYGFEDGRDFNLLKFEQVQLEGTRTVKREITDHQLTIDMAKEIAMLQRTEKGKEVREYFIRVEKEFNSPETMIARALIMASRQLEARDRLIDKAYDDVESRMANQRVGYVYIISNIGSFGENVFKIGMTRRLKPYERIYELSDASVPFNFDVHAMIPTDDAPGLEAALHRASRTEKSTW